MKQALYHFSLIILLTVFLSLCKGLVSFAFYADDFTLSVDGKFLLNKSQGSSVTLEGYLSDFYFTNTSRFLKTTNYDYFEGVYGSYVLPFQLTITVFSSEYEAGKSYSSSFVFYLDSSDPLLSIGYDSSRLDSDILFVPGSSHNGFIYAGNDLCVRDGFINIVLGTFYFVNNIKVSAVPNSIWSNTITASMSSEPYSVVTYVDSALNDVLTALQNITVPGFEVSSAGTDAMSNVNSTTQNIETYENSIFEANTVALTASGISTFKFDSFADGFVLIASITNNLYDRLPNDFKLLIQALLLIGASGLVLNAATHIWRKT